ncbi:MAG TPA: hypothetical protein VE714_07140, partial [Gemmatimonadales bacterium]|nr:hypothetical protein [Gemmatimonadales bacterium]
AFAAISVAYFAFRWLLIRFQTWKLGHVSPFIIGPEIDAALLAVVPAAIVFWAVAKQRKRRS